MSKLFYNYILFFWKCKLLINIYHYRFLVAFLATIFAMLSL